MRRHFGRVACHCLALPILCWCAVAQAAAVEQGTVALVDEQAHDRSNFIAQVRMARQGDAESQWQVGSTYAKLGDYTRALPMLRSAAAAGHSQAAALLGRLFEGGRGTEVSIDESKRWYRLAAEKGEADAMAALGRLLLHEGGAAARKAALELFQRSAQLDDPNGQYFLGWMLTEHVGGDGNDAEAYGWFLKAARQGHVGAQLAVATHLLAGRGIAKDREAAGRWLMRAAETKDPVAHYLLGRFKDEAGGGNGALNEVRQSFRVAAAAGHREAQFALATLLAKSSAEADRREAVEWFTQAHRAGHKAAANRMGELYRDGMAGGRQLDMARMIFQGAADDGDIDAMYNLAEMLNEGLGGPQDTAKALNWYARAADEGHEKASAVVRSLLNGSVKASALGLKGFWQ